MLEQEDWKIKQRREEFNEIRRLYRDLVKIPGASHYLLGLVSKSLGMVMAYSKRGREVRLPWQCIWERVSRVKR